MAAKRARQTQQKTIYIDGNTARQLRPGAAVPERRRENRLSRTAERNRAKAGEMNPGYVLFIAAAAAAMLFVCVHYLQLQADNTAKSRNIARMESELADLKAENDAAYNNIIDSVDLSKVKKTATKELGMVYAGRDQIVLYENKENDYVRQYEDVPKDGEVKSGTGD